MKRLARSDLGTRQHPARRLAILSIALLPFVPPAQGANIPPELIGVWRGTIGKQQIMACWDSRGGNYYPLRKPLRIGLSPLDPESAHWIENSGIETSSAWQLDKPAGNRLTGTWRQNESSPPLPIQLTRVKLAKVKEGQGTDCLFDGPLYKAFNAPRIAAQKIEAGEPKTFMGKTYRVIHAIGGNVASLELAGEGAPIERANKRLRQYLLDDIAGYLACDTFNPPRQGEWWTSRADLRFWNEDWLSWSGHGEGYCGGAHPFFNISTTTLDLHTGKETNLWSWFKLVKKREDDPNQICESLWKGSCLPKKLARRIAKMKTEVDRIDACKPEDFDGVMVDGSSYSVGLNPKGIAFIPAIPEPGRGFRICYARYTLPFADLLPYLAPTGKEAVERILNGSSDEPALPPPNGPTPD